MSWNDWKAPGTSACYPPLCIHLFFLFFFFNFLFSIFDYFWLLFFSMTLILDQSLADPCPRLSNIHVGIVWGRMRIGNDSYGSRRARFEFFPGHPGRGCVQDPSKMVQDPRGFSSPPPGRGDDSFMQMILRFDHFAVAEDGHREMLPSGTKKRRRWPGQTPVNYLRPTQIHFASIGIINRQ